ncbi:F0F1 ATP synthase subunit gamma [Halomonas sp. YLGW01]|uniref:F0F1 ATP synthase subunit gamma n=1 Tax=Halomonas sp. YLGW01 TaxID=2773308 RepID=UPI001782A6C9|nr:F0F1 ATP synthase subunit gamma [Halomonas sp. YLGW01]
MIDTMASLRRKIDSAGDLQAVVQTMKALAASSIGQYEHAVTALADYTRTVELGLSACFREAALVQPAPEEGCPESAAGAGSATGPVSAVVFGSDQGLVGRFNDRVADEAGRVLAALPGTPEIWAVGERVYARLVDAGLEPAGQFGVPGSVEGIAALVGQIQLESDAHRDAGVFYVFHNRPQRGSLYAPTHQRLLPLDAAWQQRLARIPWPTHNLPEVLCQGSVTLRGLIHEYLFISLYRACAESLASENASRLAAMERADRNIDELMETLHGTLHRLRQGSIDAELFDVIAGFEAQRWGETP